MSELIIKVLFTVATLTEKDVQNIVTIIVFGLFGLVIIFLFFLLFIADPEREGNS